MKKIFLIFCLINSIACASLLQETDTGLIEYKNGDYPTAKKSFIDYINSNPNDFDGYFWLAKTYQKLNDNKNAKENFILSYKILSKEKNIPKLSFDDASGSIEDYFDMALSFFEQGNYKEADFYADLMLRLNSSSQSAYFLKAKIASTLNDKEEAKIYLSKAILLNNELLNTNLAKSLNITKIPPQDKEILAKTGLNEFFQGNIEGAIENYEKYLKIDPQDADVLNILSDLYLKNDKINEAFLTAQKAIKINPRNIYGYINLAKIYKIQKQDKKLETTLLKGFKINPNNKEILLLSGNYYLKKGDYKNASFYFETLTNIDSTMYEAYFGLVYSLIEQKEIDKASSLIRKLTSFKQKGGEVLYLLSKICISLKQKEEAQDYLEQALMREPDNEIYKIELENLNKIK